MPTLSAQRGVHTKTQKPNKAAVRPRSVKSLGYYFMQKWLTHRQNSVQGVLYGFAVLDEVLIEKLEQRLQLRW